VDQIQSTPIAKPDTLVLNYEPPLESFSSKLFQIAHTGEWIFVSFLADCVSIRRVLGFDKTELTGQIENANTLDLAEGCNTILKIFATGSEFRGKALFLFRSDQLLGATAQNFAETFRWVFDLVSDHPTRTKIAVVDWHNSISKEGKSRGIEGIDADKFYL
jgi:hypothetical protein